MKIVTTSIFDCLNTQEYQEALEVISNEIADIEDMNKLCNDSMEMEVIEDIDNLKIKTITTYIR